MFFHVLSDNSLQVFSVIKEVTNATQRIFQHVHRFLATLSGEGLYTAYAGCHTTFANDFEHSDTARATCVDATTELAAGSETHNAHRIAVFLAEQSHCTHGLSLFYGRIAVFVEWQILADEIVYKAFHLTKLFVCHLLEVREVEA